MFDKIVVPKSQLFTMVNAVVGETTTTERMVNICNTALYTFGGRVRLAITRDFSSAADEAYINLGAYDLHGEDVRRVQLPFEGDDGEYEWRDAPWWMERKSYLTVRGMEAGDTLRITFGALNPRFSTTAIQTNATFTPGTSTDMVLKTRVTDLEHSGYVYVATGRIYQYVGKTYNADGTTTLRNVQAEESDSYVTAINSNTAIEPCVAMSNERALDCLLHQIYANYYMARLGSCTSTEDRTFFGQMMQFYLKEANDRWRTYRGDQKPAIKFKSEFEL